MESNQRTLRTYVEHIERTSTWLAGAFTAEGVARECWILPFGWSRESVGATSSLVPTLLEAGACSVRLQAGRVTERAGEWLLSIQRPDGAWCATTAARDLAVTGDILVTSQAIGAMVALARSTRQSRYLGAAERASRWALSACDARGESVDSAVAAHVAWMVLEAWTESRELRARDGAVRILRGRTARRLLTRGIEPMPTGLIARSLRGFLESAHILDEWDEFEPEIAPILDTLLHQSERSGGVLASAFDAHWKPRADDTSCAANAQMATNFLLFEQHERDPRIVCAAQKLVDGGCAAQHVDAWVPGLVGAVAESNGMWGRWRYPASTAKHQADALFRVAARMDLERDERSLSMHAVDPSSQSERSRVAVA